MDGLELTLWVLACGAFAIPLIVGGLKHVRLVRESSSWVSTIGRIVRADIRKDDEGYLLPEVEYRYTVDGTEYTSDVISFRPTRAANFTTKPARSVLQRFPVGSEVVVFFDPSRPESACLERDGKGTMVLLFASAILVVVVALAPVVFDW